MKKKTAMILSLATAAILILCVTCVSLVWNGIVLLNGHHAKYYEVKGIDVSAYQGKIDWQALAAQDISFAFIKATEGSSFVDKHFSYNFEEAQKTALAVGAYHFFSYDSEGKTQAENFIKTVTPFEGMLPPVIDLEFYGGNEQDPPQRSTVTPQLKTMLTMLEEHYGQKPIIYATEKSYELYLSNDYEGYDIWIRNVITTPDDSIPWTFWQYTNRERLEGYEGEERYIDMNVFSGTQEAFDSYLEANTYHAKGA